MIDFIASISDTTTIIRLTMFILYNCLKSAYNKTTTYASINIYSTASDL